MGTGSSPGDRCLDTDPASQVPAKHARRVTEPLLAALAAAPTTHLSLSASAGAIWSLAALSVIAGESAVLAIPSDEVYDRDPALARQKGAAPAAAAVPSDEVDDYVNKGKRPKTNQTRAGFYVNKGEGAKTNQTRAGRRQATPADRGAGNVPSATRRTRHSTAADCAQTQLADSACRPRRSRARASGHGGFSDGRADASGILTDAAWGRGAAVVSLADAPACARGRHERSTCCGCGCGCGHELAPPLRRGRWGLGLRASKRNARRRCLDRLLVRVVLLLRVGRGSAAATRGPRTNSWNARRSFEAAPVSTAAHRAAATRGSQRRWSRCEAMCTRMGAGRGVRVEAEARRRCEGNPQVWFDVMCGMLVLRPRVLLARMVLRCVCTHETRADTHTRTRTRTRTHVRAHIHPCLSFLLSHFLARVPARLRARASFLPLPLPRERARSLFLSPHTKMLLQMQVSTPRSIGSY